MIQIIQARRKERRRYGKRKGQLEVGRTHFSVKSHSANCHKAKAVREGGEAAFSATNCRTKVKGQFFILGAVLMCAVFFVGLPLYGPQVQVSREDLKYISDNLEREFPRALNLGMKSGSGTSSLADFSRFADSGLSGQGMDFKGFWVVAEPDGSGVRITIGNFMGTSQSASITVNGEEWNQEVPDNSTQERIFSGVPDSYQIQIGFPGHSKTSEWLREKVNLYAFASVGRGADLAVAETES